MPIFSATNSCPLRRAKVSIVTHALNYGTGAASRESVATGTPKHDQLYLFRPREHFERLTRSCGVMKMTLPLPDAELCKLTCELVARNSYAKTSTCAHSPTKAPRSSACALHDLQDDFCPFCVPFGAYHEVDKGVRCCTVSWRRVPDLASPRAAR